MDDNKVTHVNEDVITGVNYTMNKYFGDLVVSRGMKQTFICIDIALAKY